MQIYRNYKSLLEKVEQCGRPMRVLGCVPDGSPLVAVRTGGRRRPSILVTAGSHSTEHAGVSAAVELIERLETEHQVFIVPTRDPIGLNPYGHALSLGLGGVPELESFADLEELLRREGDVTFDEEDFVIALIGDFGYASCRPREDRPHPQWTGYHKLQELAREKPEVLGPFRGRRLYMVPGQAGVEGTGNFGRAYTLIIGLEGEILHLNRFHDTAWAPVEPRCIRALMAEIRPGISFDLHESQLMQDRYWLSARKQRTAEDQAWEERAARETIRAIVEAGGALAEDRDVLGGVPIEETWFTRSDKGVYWLDASVRGEGFNLMDFASREYGMAFGTEMGMYGGFEHRVKLGMVTVQSAVRVFEERFREENA